MSTTQEVTFANISVRGPWNSGVADDVHAQLVVHTPSGQSRIAEMSVEELLDVIEQATRALRQLGIRALHVKRAQERLPGRRP